MKESTFTLHRADLYEEVWKEPIRTIAQRYGVSDVTLAKVCHKLGVPVPGRGHWARVRAGEHIVKPPLPQHRESSKDTITVAARRTTAMRRIESPRPAIAIPTKFGGPHKLVAVASRLLRRKAGEDGLVRCWSTACLNIVVSPAQLSRALAVMNALIDTLEGSEMRVEVTRPLTQEERARSAHADKPDNATRVNVAGEWIEFGISERRVVSHPTPPSPPGGLKGEMLESWLTMNRLRPALVPNGKLELRITNGDYLGVRTTWCDGKRQRVENCLGDFVLHLPIMAEAIRHRREEHERSRLEYLEAQGRRLEIERAARENAERETTFVDLLRRWRLARDVREYVAEARGLVETASGADASVLDALQWAEGFARRIDPLAPLHKDR